MFALHYSYFNAFTGFELAALIVWKLTVTIAIIIDEIIVTPKTLYPISTRYAKF